MDRETASCAIDAIGSAEPDGANRQGPVPLANDRLNRKLRLSSNRRNGAERHCVDRQSLAENSQGLVERIGATGRSEAVPIDSCRRGVVGE